jgi:hypothetical protein
MRTLAPRAASLLHLVLLAQQQAAVRRERTNVAAARARLPRRLLIATLKSKFVAAGGAVLEHTAFKAATVLDDGVALELLPARLAAPTPQPGDVNRPAALAGGGGGGGGAPRRRELTARLLLDFMGHWSPVAKQLRGSRRPDGVVLVVGGAWAGFPPERNAAADLLHTFTDCCDDQQLFWWVPSTVRWEGRGLSGGHAQQHGQAREDVPGRGALSVPWGVEVCWGRAAC